MRIDKQPLRFSLATIILQGQRLRVDEVIVPTTFRLNYSAKWAQISAAVR